MITRAATFPSPRTAEAADDRLGRPRVRSPFAVRDCADPHSSTLMVHSDDMSQWDHLRRRTRVRHTFMQGRSFVRVSERGWRFRPT